MSKQLLSTLNGNNTGELMKYLREVEGEPRIAWYPSAGRDFRALLYLHPEFACLNAATAEEPPTPDLFLFTDYYPWHDYSFLDKEILFSDSRTTITIEHKEELPALDLPMDKRLIVFPEGSMLTNRVFFLKLRVESDRLSTITYPLIYAFTENTMFYCRMLAAEKAIISHLIHVRYGASLGGGRATGQWLLHVLHTLQCELFITGGHLGWGPGDKAAFMLCKSIPKHSEPVLTPIRSVHAAGWSGHEDVIWNLVS